MANATDNLIVLPYGKGARENLLSVDGGAHADWFGRLAEWMVKQLVAAGVPACAGGFMATTWRHPLPEWTALVRGWLERPDPRALIEALNVFDARAVGGTLDLGAIGQLGFERSAPRSGMAPPKRDRQAARRSSASV